jgi:23S rRNA G2069 N7-methylase RlmK/C1962 C5-methylase RlmI
MVRAMGTRKIEVARPCYSYTRSRYATKVTVYDITKDKVVEEHSPYNCIKAFTEEGVEGETIVIEFDPEKHAVFYRYRTNSNRGRIILYHLPPSITPEALAEKIRKAFKYREVYVEKARVAQDRYHILYSQYYFLPL